MTVTILVGDVLAQLAGLPDNSVDVVVTSPPYWGLRDYGVEGQIGLERTLGEHLDVMVKVFREIRRVLKPTGTLWLNYGDCFATSPNGRSAADTKATGNDDRTFRDKPFSTIGPIYEQQPAGRQAGRRSRSGKLGNGGENGTAIPSGRGVSGGVLKPKDLCMVPNRLAIALQEDGWWIRSEIVWAKPNPMPESISDRPATSHEKIFLLAKSGETTGWRARDTGEWHLSPDLSERLARPTDEDPDATVNRWRACDYFYDAVAVRQGVSEATVVRLGQDIEGQAGSARANGGTRADRPMKAHRGKSKQDQTAAVAGRSGNRMAGFNARWDAKEASLRDSFARRSKDSDGTHGQKPQFREDREAVAYPRGEGRNLRNYEPAPVQVWNIATRPFSEAHFATFPPELAERCILAGCPAGGVVLDPFGGAGTVGMVAARLGLDCTLIELNPEYAEIAARRIKTDKPCEVVTGVDLGVPGAGLPLFGGAAA